MPSSCQYLERNGFWLESKKGELNLTMHVTYPLLIPTGSPFPVTNIPFGIFSTSESPEKRVGIAIGTYILDLAILEKHDLFLNCLNDDHIQGAEPGAHVSRTSPFQQSSLNAFASLPSTIRTEVRTTIIALLQDESSLLFTDSDLNNAVFHSQEEATMHLPMQVGDFTDFMCARIHVDNCSKLAGVSTPSNFHAFPTAYNGRSSSLVVSGTPILRPHGMLLPNPASHTYQFRPSKRIDYEVELGFFVGKPVPFGERILSADEAKEHIFGFVLLNDWSARDIQFAEMRPLGPFNGKGFATTISPWVVTVDALEEAEVEIADVEAVASMAGRPQHLRHEGKKQTWSIGVEVKVMRSGWEGPVTVGRSDLKALYWSPGQMLSHHASSGCGLRTGDLLGTGTISSPGKHAADEVSTLGCLHELNMAGSRPFMLKNGEEISWIEDGDEVIISGTIAGPQGSVIGFGDCTGLLESIIAK
ncbi:putative 2-hydroxyhepta-2,4-diene-1,7-dioate isomerase [Rhexocercosporidium sp. MPI-PUGE-AT-0058]|nr:putative 2-hydroxyhepta-2,4-diene-1,7-dioate isomerase [Rhexocercosporidium sp. MPI-PUGE-AT-0058]